MPIKNYLLTKRKYNIRLDDPQSISIKIKLTGEVE